jgi:hypothetical protein
VIAPHRRACEAAQTTPPRKGAGCGRPGHGLTVFALHASGGTLCGLPYRKTSRVGAAHAEALFLEGERAQATLASIGDAVISTDVAGNITYAPGMNRPSRIRRPPFTTDAAM